MSLKPEFVALQKLINQISSRSDAEPFRDPVNWKALGLYDYPQIVKTPMDLSTVSSKLTSNKYTSVHEVAIDVRTIWSNCKRYNADQSEFWMLAGEFEKRFEEKFAKIAKDCKAEDPPEAKNAGSSSSSSSSSKVNKPLNVASNPPNTDTPPTATARQTLARNLFRLNKTELGKVITVLDEKSPESLTKNSGEDEVEINVDNISVRVFYEVEGYVEGVVGGNAKRQKKN